MEVQSNCNDLKQDYITAYASIYIGESFYIIGGNGPTPISTIGRLDSTTWSWSFAGKLNAGRSAHSVIEVHSNLLVVGGRVPKVYQFQSFCRASQLKE